VVAKLYFTPIKRDKIRQDHNSYTMHADVGQCCTAKARAWRWTKRRTNKETGNGKRLRAKDAVSASH
jgi:hypothetical protein